MGFGVGQLYTAKYFPAEAKQKIQDLVANLKAAYRARIEKLDWMGPETKKEALNQFRVIGPARNTDAWYDAFKVQSSDKMFLAPEQRVRIW